MKINVDLSAEQKAVAQAMHQKFDELLRHAETNPQALMMVEGMLLMLRASLPVPILEEFQQKVNAIKNRLQGGNA